MHDKNDHPEPERPQSGRSSSTARGKVNEDEIDLFDLLNRYILPYWKLYLAAGIAGAVIAVAISYFVTPKYEAETISLVNTNSSSSLLKGGMGGLGGLASLAGVNVNAGDSDTLFNVMYVTSRELADAFIEKYDLRRELFYKEYQKNGTYIGEAGATQMVEQPYTELEDADIYSSPGPTKEQVHRRFQSIFSINANQKEMTVTVAVTWTDPQEAKQWANAYIQLANDILKRKAIEEGSMRISFLERQITERPEVEIQQAIYSLIENEMKQIAIAESTDEYAFKVVQRAFLPESKVSPQRIKFLLAGGILGGLAMLALVLAMRALSRN